MSDLKELRLVNMDRNKLTIEKLRLARKTLENNEENDDEIIKFTIDEFVGVNSHINITEPKFEE